MTSAATTTCCGVVLAVGLMLPVAQQATTPSSQVGPTAAGFTRVWQQKLEATGAILLTPAARALIVSGAETPTHARAQDTGSTLWTDVRSTAIAPAVAGDVVFLAAQHQLIALGLPSGREIWATEIDEPITSVVANTDHVVLASAGGVRVFHPKEGRQLWSKAVSSPLSARPAVDAGRVFIATIDGALEAWNLASGALQWRAEVGTPLGALATQPARLYARGAAEGFFAYRQDHAWPRWYTLRGQVIGEPAVDDDRVYLAGLDNTIVAVDRDSGTRKWKTTLPGRPLTGPVVSGDFVVVPLATTGAIVSLLRSDGKIIQGDAEPEQAQSPWPLAFVASAGGTVIFAVTVDPADVRWLSALRRGR